MAHLEDNKILDQYVIQLDYNPETDNLANSLSALSKIVDGHAIANSILSNSFDQQITSNIALQDIQRSSIKLFIENVLKNTDDNEIKDKGARAFLHQAMVEGRKVLLEYISKHDDIDSRDDLSQIREKLVEVANNAGSQNTVGVESISDSSIADSLSGMAIPKGELSPSQNVKVIANGREFQVNKNFRVTPETLERILLDEEESWENQEIKIKIKKPAYEGKGKWVVQEVDGKTVDAKISDEPWLNKFQNNLLSSGEFPFPKDVIRVKANIFIKRDRHGFVLSRELDILKIIKIERDSAHQQQFLLDEK